MTTTTSEFIQSILKPKGKIIVNDDMSAKRQALETNTKELLQTILTEETTVISDEMEESLLEALKKLGKTEIDKEVLEEVEKMVDAERMFKRQVLKDIIKDNLS